MKRTLLIAEVGVNHNGDMELAKDLIEVASQAGADIVKFQTFISSELTTKNAQKSSYQINHKIPKESQQEMLSKLELSKSQHFELIEHCKKNNIEFLSSAFDLESIRFLETLNLNRWKIPSGEIINLPYLQQIGRQNKPTILSTGMSKVDEIRNALKILEKSGCQKENITVMQCNTAYPTPFCDANLNAIKTLRDEFEVNTGLSDHTIGIETCFAAIALGATVIEKHITLDRNMEGPDHFASLEPKELKIMISSIRNIELALGNGIKKPTPSEIENITNSRKSIYANTFIQKGEKFSEENLTIKRPGIGLSPMQWFDILGTFAKEDFNEDDPIKI